MSPNGIFTQLSLWMWIYLLNLTPFYLHFILYLHVWIQIQKDPEYESNTDPDTQYLLVLKNIYRVGGNGALHLIFPSNGQKGNWNFVIDFVCLRRRFTSQTLEILQYKNEIYNSGYRDFKIIWRRLAI